MAGFREVTIQTNTAPNKRAPQRATEQGEGIGLAYMVHLIVYGLLIFWGENLGNSDVLAL